MTKPNHPQIGRELLSSDLEPEQTVWVQKEGRRVLLPLKVEMINEHLVVLFATGELEIHLLLSRLPDGHVADDSGLPMALYEYLGKV